MLRALNVEKKKPPLACPARANGGSGGKGAWQIPLSVD